MGAEFVDLSKILEIFLLSITTTLANRELVRYMLVMTQSAITLAQ